MWSRGVVDWCGGARATPSPGCVGIRECVTGGGYRVTRATAVTTAQKAGMPTQYPMISARVGPVCFVHERGGVGGAGGMHRGQDRPRDARSSRLPGRGRGGAGTQGRW